MYYLCGTTDSGEFELLACHETLDEAKTAMKDHDESGKATWVLSISGLEKERQEWLEAIQATQRRIEAKQAHYDITLRVRQHIRQLRGTMSGDAYSVLTATYIELTDQLEKDQRYIANRMKEIDWQRGWYERITGQLVRLQSAIDKEVVQNQKAIEVLESRWRSG